MLGVAMYNLAKAHSTCSGSNANDPAARSELRRLVAGMADEGSISSDDDSGSAASYDSASEQPAQEERLVAKAQKLFATAFPHIAQEAARQGAKPSQLLPAEAVTVSELALQAGDLLSGFDVSISIPQLCSAPFELLKDDMAEDMQRMAFLTAPNIMDALQSDDERPACGCKVAAVLQLLKEHMGDAGLHAIVFVSTRHAASYVAQVLHVWNRARVQQGEPALDGIHVLKGRGKGSAPRSLQTDNGIMPVPDMSKSTGLTGSKQAEQVAAFREPGRRVLISTSVGQEGMDVPCCNLVILMTPTASGVDLTQISGRVRMDTGKMVSLVKEGSALETRKHARGQKEQQNMNAFLLVHGT